MNATVTIPRGVVERALRKARSEYVRAVEAQGSDPGPEDECWAEFEQLAEYAPAKPFCPGCDSKCPGCAR